MNPEQAAVFEIQVGEPWMWGAFALFVVIALAVDILLLERKGSKAVSFKEALNWSILWVALSFVFNGLLFFYLWDKYSAPEYVAKFGADFGWLVAWEKSLEFLAGYLIEKSLAVDNIFVFLMIFTFFATPPEYQRRALIYGIIGAIILRAIMILVGVWLIQHFHWILYVFGAFLVYTGYKMWSHASDEPDLEKNPVLKFLRSRMKITREYAEEKFFVIKDGVKYATPMFIVLIMIGVIDVVFAVDSIPAIFAITLDPFIVLTSNIFAILGLRAMYFLLANMKDKFHLLSYGLAIILVFIGTKMLLLDIYKIPVWASLGVVITVLTASMILSLKIPPREAGHPPK
ncbi:MAG: TerC family protein [Burkholderiales bacterium]|jgi:tellurite resistance protein TerC|nr:TerC family protein [Burkholderiales bacterium]